VWSNGKYLCKAFDAQQAQPMVIVLVVRNRCEQHTTPRSNIWHFND
jgi:hypothetical protein